MDHHSSVLCRCLYLTYTAPLFGGEKKCNVSVYLQADETQLYSSFRMTDTSVLIRDDSVTISPAAQNLCALLSCSLLTVDHVNGIRRAY